MEKAVADFKLIQIQVKMANMLNIAPKDVTVAMAVAMQHHLDQLQMFMDLNRNVHPTTYAQQTYSSEAHTTAQIMDPISAYLIASESEVICIFYVI